MRALIVGSWLYLLASTCLAQVQLGLPPSSADSALGFSTIPQPDASPGLTTSPLPADSLSALNSFSIPSQPWGSGNIPIPNYYPNEYPGFRYGPQPIPLYREETPGTMPLPPYYPDLKVDTSTTPRSVLPQ